MEQCVPKRRHIKFRRREITQKKAHNIQNKEKVWNQGMYKYQNMHFHPQSTNAMTRFDTFRSSSWVSRQTRIYKNTCELPYRSKFQFFKIIDIIKSVADVNFLPVVLYGCETWSLTLREERKLRVLENMVLRRIFGPRRDEVTGEWRRLHNEELNDLYCSPNIVRVIKSRRMRWAGHVARMGEEREVYRVLVGKPEGKSPLGRPRRRWVDNIRINLQEVGYGSVDWIGLAQDRDRWRTLVSAVMNLRVPWNAGNFLTSCKPASFSRRTLHQGVSKE